MRHYDVLIVGGGPAGSTLAWALRDAGLSLAVLDKARFPRDKTCAGWVTPAVISELGIDLEDYAKDRVLQPIRGFRVGRLGAAPESRYAGEPVSYGIRRFEFDDYLLRRAPGDKLLGTPLTSLERTPEGWCVNGELQADLIVGAGGHFCPVARALGADLGASETIVSAQEMEFPLPEPGAESAEGEIPELYFCDDLKGYGWVFRKGDWLNVGLGREDNHELKRHVERFLDRLVEEGRLTSKEGGRLKGHAYLLYPRARRRVVDDRALLIGDAAGLAYPQSGEGIRPAVESALMAAEVIRAAAGDYRREKLEPYAAALERRFGRRQRGTGWARFIPEALKRAVGRRLLGTRWFTRHVVMDRWFLHRHQPPLRGS